MIKDLKAQSHQHRHTRNGELMTDKRQLSQLQTGLVLEESTHSEADPAEHRDVLGGQKDVMAQHCTISDACFLADVLLYELR